MDLVLKLVSGWLTRQLLVNSVNCLCTAFSIVEWVILSQGEYMTHHFLLCFFFRSNFDDCFQHLDFILHFFLCGLVL